MPLIVKDNIDTAALPTTAGTPALADNRPAKDAAALAALLGADGGHGKDSVHEFTRAQLQRRPVQHPPRAIGYLTTGNDVLSSLVTEPTYLRRSTPMSYPWTKKNPALSLFLSSANAWAGTARGVLTKEARRQQAAATSKGAKQLAGFWASALKPPSPGGNKAKRRR